MALVVLVWVTAFLAMLSGLLVYPRFVDPAPPSWHRRARIISIPIAAGFAILAGTLYGWIWSPPVAAYLVAGVTIGTHRSWQRSRSFREQLDAIDHDPELRRKFEHDPIISRWLRRRH